MEFTYIMTKENLKKYLEKNYKKTDFIYAVLFSIFYLLISKDVLMNNYILVIFSYLIYLIILFLLLYIIRKIFSSITIKINDKVMNNRYGIYEYQINKEDIIQKFNNTITVIKWHNVSKSKKNKNSILLYIDNYKDVIVFRKEFFKNINDFYSLNTFIENK